MNILNYLSVFVGSFMAPKVLAALGTVLGLILADTLFGILSSLKNGTFSCSKLAQFVQTSLIPYMGGLLLLALFSGSNSELEALFFTITAMVTVKFLADIKAKVSGIFGGLDIQLQSPFRVKKDAVVTPEAVRNALVVEKDPVPEDAETC